MSPAPHRFAVSQARDKYQAEMAKLKKQSQVAKGKLDELKPASEDKWDAMVAETDKIRDAFVRSFDYFKSRVEHSPCADTSICYLINSY
jgi:hypothetical protein